MKIYKECPEAEGLLSIGITKIKNNIDEIKILVSRENLCIKYFIFVEGYELDAAIVMTNKLNPLTVKGIGLAIINGWGLSRAEIEELVTYNNDCYSTLSNQMYGLERGKHLGWKAADLAYLADWAE